MRVLTFAGIGLPGRAASIAAAAGVMLLLAAPLAGGARAGTAGEPGGAAGPAGAWTAAETPLNEDMAVRFIASIGPMRRLGRDIASRSMLVETNKDDPLTPYALLSPDQLAGEGELPRLLARLGFVDIGQWLAVGKALLEAYYEIEAEARGQHWRQQLIGVVASLRGIDREPPGRRGELMARLEAELNARAGEDGESRVPPAHLELARKFHHSLELATQFD